MPYGFPSGHDLYKEICTGLTQVNEFDWREKLIELGVRDYENIIRFSKSLFFSGMKSIDSFLEHRPEFMEIGKLCICLSLIPREQEARLFSLKERHRSWYEYLFNCLLTTNIADFFENRLSIITFNYDRSLEHYLYTTIKNTFGIKNEAKIIEIMKHFSIIHVYGQLGSLPWQKPVYRPYSPSASNLQIIEASKQIKLLSDKEESSVAFRKAFMRLSVSKRILILGFGYDSMNLRRLQLGRLRECIIRGTSYKLGNAEVRAIKEVGNNIRIAKSRLDIMNFFKEEVPLN